MSIYPLLKQVKKDLLTRFLLMDKIFYNEGSAAKLGWTPDWFGCDDFDDDLIESITKFQKEHGLATDGLMGPTTYRRIYIIIELQIWTTINLGR